MRASTRPGLGAVGQWYEQAADGLEAHGMGRSWRGCERPCPTDAQLPIIPGECHLGGDPSFPTGPSWVTYPYRDTTKKTPDPMWHLWCRLPPSEQPTWFVVPPSSGHHNQQPADFWGLREGSSHLCSLASGYQPEPSRCL